MYQGKKCQQCDVTSYMTNLPTVEIKITIEIHTLEGDIRFTFFSKYPNAYDEVNFIFKIKISYPWT